MKPQRHNNHILENKSNKFFNNQLPSEWFVDKPDNDYGIDYVANIVVNNEVTGLNFSVQLKSKEVNTNKRTVNIQFKTSTLNFYRARLEPIMIVAYVQNDDEAYWTWFDEISISDNDLVSKEHLYLKISKAKRLSELDWNLVTKKVQKHFGIKTLIDSFSKLEYETLSQTEILAWKNYFTQNFTDSVYYFKKSLEVTELKNRELVLQGLAHSLYQLFSYSEALTYINQSLEIEKSENALLTKACILAEQGIATSNKTKLLNAREIFKSFLETNNREAIYHYNYANTLYNLQEFENAIKHFKICLQLKPDYAEAWKNLGTVYYYLHNHEEEIKCYDKALTINPNLHQALFSKGVTLALIFEKYEEGIALMVKSINLNEHDLSITFPRGYYCLALAYFKMGNNHEALKYIDKGLEVISEDWYLLNLKLQIIEDDIDKNALDKNYVSSFLQLLLELKDERAVYYLNAINEYDDIEILRLLKKHVRFFSGIKLEHLANCNIQLKGSLIFLKHLQEYDDFRSRYAILSHLENLDFNEFEVPRIYWDIFEFIAAISFANAIEYIITSENIDKLEINAIIRNDLLKLIPLINELIPYPKIEFSTEEKIAIFSKIIVEYRSIILRELSRQYGYLLGKFGLGNSDEDDNEDNWFSKSYFDDIFGIIMDTTNDKLQLLPK